MLGGKHSIKNARVRDWKAFMWIFLWFHVLTLRVISYAFIARVGDLKEKERNGFRGISQLTVYWYHSHSSFISVLSTVPPPCLESSPQLAATVEPDSQISRVHSGMWELGPCLQGWPGITHMELLPLQEQRPKQAAKPSGRPCHSPTPLHLVASQPAHCSCTRASGSPAVTPHQLI